MSSEQFIHLWIQLAISYHNLANFDEALKAGKKALELAKGNANVLELLGDIYEDIGNVKESCDYYKRSTETAPNNGYAWQKLALIYEALGNEEELKKAQNRATFLISESEKDIKIRKKVLKDLEF